jgi:hypothetical protein
MPRPVSTGHCDVLAQVKTGRKFLDRRPDRTVTPAKD